MGEFDAWEPEGGPPQGFAERVVEAATRPQPVARRPREGRARALRAGAAIALVSVAAAVALLVWRSGAPGGPAAGEASALDRRAEVAVGARAALVLEPGAHVTWSGDDVVQSSGDVFYRVEPRPGGAAFRVHTAAGDVTVLGTCFRVKVNDMNRRDVTTGAAGAAIGALALVAVYEGRVAVSRANDSVEVRAGGSARLDARGPHATGVLPGELASARDTTPPGEATPGDPLLAANENLAGQVRSYRQQLEQNEAAKKALEARLKTAEARLAVQATDGAPVKSAWDLSPDDWKQLAAEGTVKARYPCPPPDGPFKASADLLQNLGLPPEDAPALEAAYQRSTQRLSDVVASGCARLLGAELAARLGAGVCGAVVSGSAKGSVQQDDMKKVALIRAGELPVPAADDPSVDPYERMLLAQTGAMKAFESDLAQAIGPADAHRVAYDDNLSSCSSVFSSGPTPKLPPR